MLKLVIDGRTVEIDPSDLTLGEAQEIEERVGVPFGEVGDLLSRGSMKATAALALVVARRNDPTIREDDIAAVSISSIGGDDPPAEAGPEAGSA